MQSIEHSSPLVEARLALRSQRRGDWRQLSNVGPRGATRAGLSAQRSCSGRTSAAYATRPHHRGTGTYRALRGPRPRRRHGLHHAFALGDAPRAADRCARLRASVGVARRPYGGPAAIRHELRDSRDHPRPGLLLPRLHGADAGGRRDRRCPRASTHPASFRSTRLRSKVARNFRRTVTALRSPGRRHDGFFIARPGTTPPITDANGDVVPGSIATLEKVHLPGWRPVDLNPRL